MGKAYPKNVFVVYQEFIFNWNTLVLKRIIRVYVIFKLNWASYNFTCYNGNSRSIRMNEWVNACVGQE